MGLLGESDMTRHHPESEIHARWPRPEPYMDAVAASGLDGGVTSRVEENDLASVANDLMPLHQELIEAEHRSDAMTLARLGWILFGIADQAQQTQREAVVQLTELHAAARAVSAGEGSRASLALLRHVLSKHGWLPPPDATPLQVLAAPCAPVSPPISKLRSVGVAGPGVPDRSDRAGRGLSLA